MGTDPHIAKQGINCPACRNLVEPGSQYCGVCGNKVDDDPLIGSVLNNRFVIEAKLGQGGFGAVYRGTQKVSGRKVALKLLHPELALDENLVARFRRDRA